jgi:L-rhamnose-H+ transport protein
MNFELAAGALLTLAGGILQGTFAVPMKFARRWTHENTWLLFCLSGMVVFPWILTWIVVPSLPAVYAATPSRTIWLILFFGLLWGVGATLTGLGLRLLGIGLGFSIILGLSASVGSLVPILALTPERLFTSAGTYYLAGSLVMFVGLGVVAQAGSLRQKSEERLAATTAAAVAATGTAGSSTSSSSVAAAPDKRPTFLAGLLVCIAAGVLSSTLNFSFAFGTEAIEQARNFGASTAWAPNVAAVLATTGGFVANLIYCGWRMRQNSSWSRYWAPGTGSHWAFGLWMGLAWYGGLAVYAMGIDKMGPLGTAAGWPMLMGTIIVSSNLAGLITGEWTAAGARAKQWLFAGSAVILVALAILALAQGGS